MSLGIFGSLISAHVLSMKYLLVFLSLSGAAGLLSTPPLALPGPASKAAALTLVAITFWATGVIAEHITALLFFVAAMVLSVATPDVVFSGFASAAVWLVFSGLVVGLAITNTGLGARIADQAVACLQGDYQRVITGVVLAGLLFSFVMPSAMGRVVLLTPIASSMAASFGFKEGSNGRIGIVLAIILGTYIPAFAILPANVPNMALVGMAETQYQLSILYGSYLLLHFPFLALAKGACIVALIIRFFPDQPVAKDDQAKARGQLTKNEIILALVLIVMLGLWMTDWLHHVSPAWIGLAGAVVLLMPGIEIVDRKQFNQRINWASILFIAGILGLGGMINQSGLGLAVAKGIVELLPLGQGHEFVNYCCIALASAATGIVTTLPAVPAVFTPLSGGLAATTGLPVMVLLMIQVIGFSTVLLPYQAPPIVVGMQMSGEKIVHAARICLALAAVTVVLLLPLNYLWWKILGGI